MNRDPVAHADVFWDEEGALRSATCGDVYFSRAGGLAESQTVFLQGCGLPERWRGRTEFVVAELGFGAGRNVAALLDLWRRDRPAGGRLTVFTVEERPLRREDAARALNAWPQIAGPARRLIEAWPPLAHGFHRIDFAEIGAGVDIATMEAAEALAEWSGRADAWFLDGFAPAKNPDLWREEVIHLVRARSASGARLATYTVAADVREALTKEGFTVTRAAGFGRKRERLEARMPGPASGGAAPGGKIAVIGAGIAGVALMRAFAARGAAARLFDAGAAGAGASGGPAALVAPRLDAGLAAPAALFAQAQRRATELYRAVPGVVLSEGAIQLAMSDNDARRFAKIAASDLFAPGEMELLSLSAAASAVGEAVERCALQLTGAITITPRSILSALAPDLVRRRVAALEPAPTGWRLLAADGTSLYEADIVCLAAGMASAALTPGLALSPVRGQATLAESVAVTAGILFGGYAIAADGGVLFGATHERGDAGTDLRAVDDAANLALAARALPILAARLAAAPRRGWAAVRATTRDYLPLAGAAPQAPPGLFVLSGLGSRGFCLAPLLAEHVVALALRAPSPLPLGVARLVAPSRFAERARRRPRLAADSGKGHLS